MSAARRLSPLGVAALLATLSAPAGLAQPAAAVPAVDEKARAAARAKDVDESAAPEKRRHELVPQTLDADAARTGMDRAIQYLLDTQHDDGSWASPVIEGLIDSGYSPASFFDWQVAAQALACMALLSVEEDAARRGALLQGIDWLCRVRLPKRGSDWDNDTVWAGLYGTVACVWIVDDPRFAADGPHAELRAAAERRGREFLRILLRNQVPTGGWGYYDNPPYSQRPKWGTSFSTALVLPAMKRALELGWYDDERVLTRAAEYVRRCRLPNGAYEYDLNPIPRAPAGEHINGIKGSLGRIQVCNWALGQLGDASITAERIRTGLEEFFEHHRFLDIARMRPIPHEAYYANAGYFYFFGHYYCGEVIELLPEAEREHWHALLRPQILKTQRKNGSFCDYLGQEYLVVSSTAFAVIALQRGL